MFSCTAGIRLVLFGPTWLQKLLKVRLAIIDFELPTDIAEIEPGMEYLTDAQAGFTPAAPTVMKFSEAKITGFEDLVQVEVEEFTMNYDRKSLSDDPVNGERCIISTGLYKGSRRTRCYSIFSEIGSEQGSDGKPDNVVS